MWFERVCTCGSRGLGSMNSVCEKGIIVEYHSPFVITTMFVHRVYRGRANLKSPPALPEYEHDIYSDMQDQNRSLSAAGRFTRKATAMAKFESDLFSIHQVQAPGDKTRKIPDTAPFGTRISWVLV